MSRYCSGCVYFGSYLRNCDYIFIEGHSRGCPPGKGCTKRISIKNKKAKPPFAYDERARGRIQSWKDSVLE